MTEPTNPIAAMLAGPTGAAFVHEQAQQVLAQQVRKRLAAEITGMVEVAFSEHLDAETYAQLQQAASDMVLDQLAAATVDPLQPGDEIDDDTDDVPELVYPDVGTFVRDKIAYSYRREVTEGIDRRWCPEWWRHEEANSRLEALWRAWEHLRLDPATGMSVWWRDHADHHMEKLFDPEGPFKACSVREGHAVPDSISYIPALPMADEPSALFTIDAAGADTIDDELATMR